MYRFNMIVAPIVALVSIKHVNSSVSYQWAISQKYHWHGHESPSGYGPLDFSIVNLNFTHIKSLYWTPIVMWYYLPLHEFLIVNIS